MKQVTENNTNKGVELIFWYRQTLASQLKQQGLQWKNANFGKMYQQNMEAILMLHLRGLLTAREKEHAFNKLLRLILANIEPKQPIKKLKAGFNNNVSPVTEPAEHQQLT